MRITLSSVFVEDQAQALRFYTEVLEFEKQTDIPAGEARWLTVISPEGAEGVELLLEPNTHPAAAAYQKAIFEDGIPATSFASTDLMAEHRRLSEAGVVFRGEPMDVGPAIIAVFEDTCGNLIQLHQVK